MEAKGLAFFGKISAGMTHEIKNVLAIINESNGLMSDLLSMAKDSPFPHRDRFLRAISKIGEQVGRGVKVSAAFNRFAHSVDCPVSRIDLKEAVDEAIALNERFARLKRVELEASLAGEAVFVEMPEFVLQMVLGESIECCLTQMGGPGAISLRVRGETRPRIDVCCKGGCGGDGAAFRQKLSALETWRQFEETCAALGATVEWLPETDGFSIVLSEKRRGNVSGRRLSE